MKISLTLVLGLLAVLTLTACSKKNSDFDSFSESAQQIGEIAASIDESGGSSSGSLAVLDQDKILRQLRPMFARHGLTAERLSLIPEANATSCLSAPGFGSCNTGANTITRDFNGCTVAGFTFNGSVVFTWGGGAANCHMTAVGHTVSRTPNFTVTGYQNYVYTASKTGTFGQKITWNSGSVPSVNFSFANDGIRRTLTASGTTVLDFTTITTSSIGISGTNRVGRVVNGGTLRVTNNLSGVSCDYSPSAVTWTSSCVCPTSGSWTGTCSDGKTSSLVHTGCGTANYTVGSDTGSITFDRCY